LGFHQSKIDYPDLAMRDFEYDKLTEKIIGCCFEGLDNDYTDLRRISPIIFMGIPPV
jgi:hypothetical protein